MEESLSNDTGKLSPTFFTKFPLGLRLTSKTMKERESESKRSWQAFKTYQSAAGSFLAHIRLQTFLQLTMLKHLTSLRQLSAVIWTCSSANPPIVFHPQTHVQDVTRFETVPHRQREARSRFQTEASLNPHYGDNRAFWTKRTHTLTSERIIIWRESVRAYQWAGASCLLMSPQLKSKTHN